MLFILTGQTLSGKTTLAKQLQKELGLKIITTYTTRPKRENEVNGLDYYFVDRQEIESDKYVGHRYFYTKYRQEPFIYAIFQDDLFPFNDSLIISDPKGVRAIKDIVGSTQTTTIYIDANKDLLIERGKERGDSIEEVYRRLKVDRDDFISAKYYADIVLDPSKHDMLQYMKELLTGGNY